MRITGGTLSGRKLSVPSIQGVRPMRDAVRLAMFNILGRRVEGCRFLDLFAGTGSIGIEALSRGAASAIFVEQLPAALKTLEENLHAFQLAEHGQVVVGDVFQVLNQLQTESPFDLIFAGPPYGKSLAHRALEMLSEMLILSSDGLVLVEVFRKETLCERYQNLVQVDSRLYGDNLLLIYQWESKP